MSVDLRAFPGYRAAAKSNSSSLAARDRIANLERVCDLGAAVPLVGKAPEDGCGIDRVSAMVGTPVLLLSSILRREPAVRRVYLCW
jgi:hypothetical protein